VTAIVNVGYCPDRWRRTMALADRRCSVSAVLGLHPQHANEWTPRTCDELAAAISRARAVAIGEIGLDYYRCGADPATQRRAFEAQLDLARALDRPIIVHQRAAEEDMVRILSRFELLPPLVLHSFEGTDRLADFARSRGFFVGVGGLATRSKSDALRRVLATIPSELLVLETDSPYLVPRGVSQRRNVPANLPMIAERVCSLWGLSPDQLATRTTRTAERIFGLGADEGSGDNPETVK
jgi:TatD DNase family protein